MLGAIAGDIIGSVYETDNLKSTDIRIFHGGCRFTDDSVLTIAIADAILEDGSYEANLKQYARLYPNAGYGMHFIVWALRDEQGPYGSWSNGAAMRVSPVGGDSDTIACITGGIAHAFYGGVPERIATRALELLDDPLRGVALEFCHAYGCL